MEKLNLFIEFDFDNFANAKLHLKMGLTIMGHSQQQQTF